MNAVANFHVNLNYHYVTLDMDCTSPNINKIQFAKNIVLDCEVIKYY